MFKKLKLRFGYRVIARLLRMNYIIKKLLAKAFNTTQKNIIEKALDFYFDYIDSIVAYKIIENVENKKIKTYSKDEVYKILGIE